MVDKAVDVGCKEKHITLQSSEGSTGQISEASS